MTIPATKAGSKAGSDGYKVRRQNDRVGLSRPGYVHQDGLEVPCTIVDLSLGGAKLLFDNLSFGSVHDKPCIVEIQALGRYPADFRWRAGMRAGVSFRISHLQRLALSARIEQLLTTQEQKTSRF